MVRGIITKAEINACCKNILLGLERRGVERMSDLENWMGLSLQVPRTTHRVETKRTEDYQGKKYFISYILPGKGFPLEIELDPVNDYTKVIVKGNFHLRRYQNHTHDVRGNPINQVLVEKCSIEIMKAELDYITKSKITTTLKTPRSHLISSWET